MPETRELLQTTIIFKDKHIFLSVFILKRNSYTLHEIKFEFIFAPFQSLSQLPSFDECLKVGN